MSRKRADKRAIVVYQKLIIEYQKKGKDPTNLIKRLREITNKVAFL